VHSEPELYDDNWDFVNHVDHDAGRASIEKIRKLIVDEVIPFAAAHFTAGLVERIGDAARVRRPQATSTREMRGGEGDHLVDDQFPDLLDGRSAGVVVDVVHEVPVVVVQLRLGVHEVTQEQPLLSPDSSRRTVSRGVPTRLKRADAGEKALLALEELHA